jgi:glyoxylase-like metal-dependent hydrolase (beta-lactamase superfamily II)
MVPPTHTFEDSATLDIGVRRVQLEFLGRGHTNHDIVITVPDANVLFAGDLVSQGTDEPCFHDAYPLDWPERMKHGCSERPAPSSPATAA